MYLASWDNQDLSVTHQRYASTEWLVFSWTFQHRMLSIDLSWVETSSSVHPFINWKTCGTQLSFVIPDIWIKQTEQEFPKVLFIITKNKNFPLLSLSGTYLKYVFMLQMAGTDWSCSGEELPWKKTSVPKWKLMRGLNWSHLTDLSSCSGYTKVANHSQSF